MNQNRRAVGTAALFAVLHPAAAPDATAERGKPFSYFDDDGLLVALRHGD